MRRSLPAAALAALAFAVALPAQSAEPPGVSGTLAGTVRDSRTGRALPRGQVCASLPTGGQRCGELDSTGTYHIADIPLGRRAVDVVCWSIGRWPRPVASDTIVVRDSIPVRRDWSVSDAGCARLPLRRVSGVFRGHYASGFEHSEFRPCPADSWVPDSLRASPSDVPRAWLEWRPDTLWKRVRWPDVPDHPDPGMSRVYVRVRGTVVGPGYYGHMSASSYEIVVDSILEVRRPGRRDCAAPR